VAVVILAILIGYYMRDKLKEELRDIYRQFKRSSGVIKVLSLALLSYVIVLGQYPPIIGDTGFYHAQAVRWLEEAGTVVGLGNLQGQFAHNNSWFVLQALFGFTFLQHSPLHVMNGLVLLILGAYCLSSSQTLVHEKATFSKFLTVTVLLLAILYLAFYVPSLSTDLPAASILLITVLYIVGRVEQRNTRVNDIAVGLVMVLFLLTIKLSTLPAILLIFFLVLKERAFVFESEKNLYIISALSLLVMLPWFIGNYLLSGYLVFPFHKINLFTLDWKLPLQYVIDYKKQIYMANMYPHLGGTEISAPTAIIASGEGIMKGISITGWFPYWIKQYTIIDRFLLYSAMISLASLTLVALRHSLHKRKLDKIRLNEYYLVSVLCIIALIFWFLNGPDIRYAYGFLILMVASQVALWMYIYNQYTSQVYLKLIKILIPALMICSLTLIEIYNFLVPRTITEEQYNYVYENAKATGKNVLEDNYGFHDPSETYRLKLFLPLLEKISIVRLFSGINVFELYDANGKLPIPSDRGYYRPVDGMKGLSRRIVVPSPYPIIPVRPVKLENTVIYQKDNTLKSLGGWYDPFPYVIGNVEDLQLRGSTIKEGFRRK
jgi:hypothetical protein|tara:strand:+ start:3599 stop:5410 length:1812 start_codon:yes stop_codon:yes gene_type:complete